MTSRPADVLDLLSRQERALVTAVSEPPGRDPEPESLHCARLRLRNIVEKYSEELKRARLGAGSARVDRRVAELKNKLEILTRAHEACRKQLAAIGTPE
ncbi:MAG: hypothetical protein WD397_10235 [Wenzhouxiangellaceae bacterium]